MASVTESHQSSGCQKIGSGRADTERMPRIPSSIRDAAVAAAVAVADDVDTGLLRELMTPAAPASPSAPSAAFSGSPGHATTDQAVWLRIMPPLPPAWMSTLSAAPSAVVVEEEDAAAESRLCGCSGTGRVSVW